MDPSVTYWVILSLAMSPVYVLLGWGVFDDLSGFVEALKYAIKPDLMSWMQGEWAEDWWAEMRLYAWVFACAALTVGAHLALQKTVFADKGDETARAVEPAWSAVGFC